MTTLLRSSARAAIGVAAGASAIRLITFLLLL
jgi:hypothetical protein